MNNERIKAIIRLVVMAILTLNAGLVLSGHSPIPFDETAVTEWITVGAAGLSTLWSWWKNNNITAASQSAQSVLKSIKEDGDGSDGAVFEEE